MDRGGDVEGDMVSEAEGKMSGNHVAQNNIAGPVERVLVSIEGEFVRVRETWDMRSRNLPFCPVPRGARFPSDLIQRVVPMYRSEAVKLGLIR